MRELLFQMSLFLSPVTLWDCWCSLNVKNYTGYDSDTDDEEVQKTPPAKRKKLENSTPVCGPSTSSASSTTSDMESCIPFLLTKVRGIPSQYNTKNMAVGIKGMYNVGISTCALLSIDIIFNPFTPELPVTASIN